MNGEGRLRVLELAVNPPAGRLVFFGVSTLTLGRQVGLRGADLTDSGLGVPAPCSFPRKAQQGDALELPPSGS